MAKWFTQGQQQHFCSLHSQNWKPGLHPSPWGWQSLDSVLPFWGRQWAVLGIVWPHVSKVLSPLTYSSFSPCQLKSEVETSGWKGTVWLKLNFPPVNSFLWAYQAGAHLNHMIAFGICPPSPHPFYGLKVFVLIIFLCWGSLKPLKGQTSEIPFGSVAIPTLFCIPQWRTDFRWIFWLEVTTLNRQLS